MDVQAAGGVFAALARHHVLVAAEFNQQPAVGKALEYLLENFARFALRAELPEQLLECSASVRKALDVMQERGVSQGFGRFLHHSNYTTTANGSINRS